MAPFSTHVQSPARDDGTNERNRWLNKTWIVASKNVKKSSRHTANATGRRSAEDRAASALNRLQSRSKGIEPNPTPHFNVAKAESVQSGLISATLNGGRGKKCFNGFVRRCSLLYIQVRSAFVPTALYTNRKICKGDQTQKRRRSSPDAIQWNSNRQ